MHSPEASDKLSRSKESPSLGGFDVTSLEEIADHIESRLRYRFARLDLLREALTHTSFVPTTGPAPMERLEFLGDAVLGLAVTELLLRRHSQATEGELTMARSRLVNTHALAERARQIGLNQVMLLGKGEEKTGGRKKPSILADVFEALLGAVFLDGGFEAARRVVEMIFDVDEEIGQTTTDDDAKTSLQEMTQRLFRQLPIYETLSVEGPDHARNFVVQVSVGQRVLGIGSGRSKRLAAQEAARRGLEELRRDQG
jgi:ribonuclease-3